MEKHRVVVSILGKEYSLVSEVDPEYIKKTAAYLDSKMREVSESYPNMNEGRIAVLAALNIADELFKITDNADKSGGSVEKKLQALARKLSESL